MYHTARMSIVFRADGVFTGTDNINWYHLYYPLIYKHIVPPQLHSMFWREHNHLSFFICLNYILVIVSLIYKITHQRFPHNTIILLVHVCWAAEINVVSRLSNSHKLLSDIQHPRQSTHCFCFDNLKRKHWEYNMRNSGDARHIERFQK